MMKTDGRSRRGGWGWHWAAGARNLRRMSKKPMTFADLIGNPNDFCRSQEALRELPGRTSNPR